VFEERRERERERERERDRLSCGPEKVVCCSLAPFGLPLSVALEQSGQSTGSAQLVPVAGSLLSHCFRALVVAVELQFQFQFYFIFSFQFRFQFWFPMELQWKTDSVSMPQLCLVSSAASGNCCAPVRCSALKSIGLSPARKTLRASIQKIASFPSLSPQTSRLCPMLC